MSNSSRESGDSELGLKQVALTHTRRIGRTTYHETEVTSAIKQPSGNQQPLIVSSPTSTTSTPEPSTDTTSETSTGETLEMFPPETYRTPTSGPLELLARIFRWLEEGRDLKAIAETFSSTHLISLKRKDLAIFSLKTCLDFYQSTEEKPLPTSSGRLHKWGMTASGSVLTVRTLEYPRTGNACSLSDILEENPDPKYFLSTKTAEAWLEMATGKIVDWRTQLIQTSERVPGECGDEQ